MKINNSFRSAHAWGGFFCRNPPQTTIYMCHSQNSPPSQPNNPENIYQILSNKKTLSHFPQSTKSELIFVCVKNLQKDKNYKIIPSANKSAEGIYLHKMPNSNYTQFSNSPLKYSEFCRIYRYCVKI